MLRNGLFFIFLIFQIGFVFAQKNQKEIHEHFPTRHTSLKKKKRHKVKQKKFVHIYTTNGNKTLYGSPCGISETQKMGFEYVVEPTKSFRSKTVMGKFLNNIWAKTKLFFTRSPFWKMILNKRIRKCAVGMGETVG